MMRIEPVLRSRVGSMDLEILKLRRGSAARPSAPVAGSFGAELPARSDRFCWCGAELIGHTHAGGTAACAHARRTRSMRNLSRAKEALR
jgi:hypothetical protein